jgi:anti-sigma B factor antagonist
MTIEQQTLSGVVVLSIAGDLTMVANDVNGVADRVRSALLQGERRFLLDLRRTRYVDSTGLGDLVQAHAAARNRGGALKLLNVTKRLNDLLILTRLLTVFDCYDDKDEAFDSFNALRETATVARQS